MIIEVPRAKVRAPDGIVLVDKPQGMSSHDVVAKIRRLANTKKVGHGGTLDPAATGVLVVGVGKATRLLHYVQANSKGYCATIRFGQATKTDDAQGEFVSQSGANLSELRQLARVLDQWRGRIEQIPCSVSAKKIAGQRAYNMVREGKEVQLGAVEVEVKELSITDLQPQVLASGLPIVDANMIVECSSGTYVRALARDIGLALGVGAHLTALRRTRSGDFSLSDTLTLSQLSQQIIEDNNRIQPLGLRVISLAQALSKSLPTIELGSKEVACLAYGQAIRVEGKYPKYLEKENIGVVDCWGEAVAICLAQDAQLQPKVVFQGS